MFWFGKNKEKERECFEETVLCILRVIAKDGRCLMATIEEVKAKMEEVRVAAVSAAAKSEEVLGVVIELKNAGTPGLDELLAKATEARDALGVVTSKQDEAIALDPTPNVPSNGGSEGGESGPTT